MRTIKQLFTKRAQPSRPSYLAALALQSRTRRTARQSRPRPHAPLV